MRHITLGDRRYRILCAERDGQWTAQAQREDTGDPFGIECAAPTEDDAVARLTRWLEWQAEHAEALADLQGAERAYHRTIAGSAFASPSEGPSAIEMQKESLDEVEAARSRLDEIRARRPVT
jgi:acyl transferase domain-containing protein